MNGGMRPKRFGCSLDALVRRASRYILFARIKRRKVFCEIKKEIAKSIRHSCDPRDAMLMRVIDLSASSGSHRSLPNRKIDCRWIKSLRNGEVFVAGELQSS